MRLLVLLLLSGALVAYGQSPTRRPENESVRHEAELAIDKALYWLKAQQRADGSWGDAGHPEQTAMALLAFLRNAGEEWPARPEFQERALAWLRGRVAPSPWFDFPRVSREATAFSLLALLLGGEKADGPLVRQLYSSLNRWQSAFQEVDAKTLATIEALGTFRCMFPLESKARMAPLPAFALSFLKGQLVPDKATAIQIYTLAAFFSTTLAAIEDAPRRAREITLHLINTQSSAGTWRDETGELRATLYALLALKLANEAL